MGHQAAISSTRRALPDWPRGLRGDLAAAYVGLSEATFRRLVEAGAVPPPVRLTPGRQVWLRETLDAYLDRAAGQPAASAPEDIWDR